MKDVSVFQLYRYGYYSGNCCQCRAEFSNPLIARSGSVSGRILFDCRSNKLSGAGDCSAEFNHTRFTGKLAFSSFELCPIDSTRMGTVN